MPSLQFEDGGALVKWFRFYHDAIDDPKVQRLPGDLFKFWVNMLCLASRSSDRGVVKLDLPEIAFAMRLDDDEAETMIDELCRRNLLEEFVEGFAIHNWDSRQFKSDSSAERVAKHRRNAAATADETDAEDNVTADVTLQDSKRNDPVTPKPSVNTDSDTDSDTEAEQSGGAVAPAPAKPAPKRKHRVPGDFTVTDKMRAWVADKLPHVPERAIEPETEKFLDYYGSTGEMRVDWVKSWNNWMRRVRPSEYTQHPANITPFQSNTHRRPPGQRGYSADELLAMAREEANR